LLYCNEFAGRKNQTILLTNLFHLKPHLQKLLDRYKCLINVVLPATYSFPVQYNPCFGRIVLDWLFQDCWYRHLQQNKTAFTQLDELQLKAAIRRMEEWLVDLQLLIADNEASLHYRKKAFV